MIIAPYAAPYMQSDRKDHQEQGSDANRHCLRIKEVCLTLSSRVYLQTGTGDNAERAAQEEMNAPLPIDMLLLSKAWREILEKH
jgi:hypothetical protein